MTEIVFEVRLDDGADESPKSKQFRSRHDAEQHAKARVQDRGIERAEIWMLGGPKGPDLVREIRREPSWEEIAAEKQREIEAARRQGTPIYELMKRDGFKPPNPKK
jgi:hypothetical protein